MALINCPKCNFTVSDEALYCGNCAHSLQEETAQVPGKRRVIAQALLEIIMGIILMDKSETGSLLFYLSVVCFLLAIGTLLRTFIDYENLPDVMKLSDPATDDNLKNNPE